MAHCLSVIVHEILFIELTLIIQAKQMNLTGDAIVHLSWLGKKVKSLQK